MLKVLASSGPCGPGGSSAAGWWAVLATVLIMLAYLGLLTVADGYGQDAGIRRRITSLALQWLGLAGVGAGEVLNLLNIHRDRCGRVVSSGAETAALWLLVLGLVAIMAGSLIRAGAEWLAFAAVGLMDLWLLAVLAASPTPDKPTVVVILATHGTATWLATWWSRQVRGAGGTVRAKVSEAGWLLVGGWLIIALLGIASIGQPAGLLLPNSTVIQALVSAAVLLALGPGRTKYIEAVEELGEATPLPDRLSWARHVIAQRVPLHRQLRPVRRTPPSRDRNQRLSTAEGRRRRLRTALHDRTGEMDLPTRAGRPRARLDPQTRRRNRVRARPRRTHRAGRAAPSQTRPIRHRVAIPSQVNAGRRPPGDPLAARQRWLPSCDHRQHGAQGVSRRGDALSDDRAERLS